MAIAVDTHVHVYPEADAGQLLVGAASRLRALAPEADVAICLTERAGQHVFATWAASEAVPGKDLLVRRIEGPGGVALRVETGEASLTVLPGRQVATGERLEVLALGRDLELADGQAAAESIQAALGAQAVPVLTWAFGKWWFGRSHKVQALIDAFARERLWLGDTTMRPSEWPQGGIMRRAVARGVRVLAGSDPLPAAGEIRYAGCYGTLLHNDLDPDDPAGSILQGFRDLPPGGRSIGRRCTLLASLQRMMRQKRCC